MTKNKLLDELLLWIRNEIKYIENPDDLSEDETMDEDFVLDAEEQTAIQTFGRVI